MSDNTYKAIIAGYVDKHTRDTYKLYNLETNRVIVTRYVNWAEWKITDPAETLNMFCNTHKEDFLTGI